MGTFYPYPRTPHLPGSHVIDDDKTCTQARFDELATGAHVVVQEKVDGTNVSLHFEGAGQPVLQKRSGLILSREHQQYEHFRSWVFQNFEVLRDMLGTRWCLFGEWLWARHGVAYDSLPDHFLGFDAYDKQGDRWATHRELVALVAERVALVPVLSCGPAAALPRLDALMGRSRFGSERAEGMYLRLERDDEVVARFKFRRADFTPGREDFRTREVTNVIKKTPSGSDGSAS